MISRTPRCLGIQLALVLCLPVVGGCAGLPRIDPSGERCFIWPARQASVVPASGNQTAPPVFTDPVFPQPQVVTPDVVPGATPPPALPVPTVPTETLIMTPDRILAPVGSEVILKTGVCTNENFLLTCQRVDWLVAREGVGQIVAMGGRGWLEDPLLPWNKARKVDNQYGIGYTAHIPYTIDRGTAEPSDDVAIEPGHAWASITSPVEGTSLVTAVSPAVAGWPERRATAAIYWVDVQWEFPPATISSSATQVLSTVVRRQSDGSPLAGWVVRYEVAEGMASLTGGTTGQVVEVVTGPDGKASVEVTPTGGTGSTTRINLQLIRPGDSLNSSIPRIIVANGTTTLNWSGGDTYLPPADNLEQSIPTYPIPGSSGDQSGTPITPGPTSPTTPSTPGRPMLDIEILGSDTGQVGGEARFEVIIRNTGGAPATGLMMDDRFDQGFRHLADSRGVNHIDKALAVTLMPGQEHKEYITFEIVRGGNLCHDLRVRSAEGAEAAKRACINVPVPEPGKEPGLEVRKDGPRLATVGETTLFTLSVKNTGEVPLTNVEILDEYDTALLAKPRTEGYKVIRNPDNKQRFRWDIPRLEVGQSQRFEVDCTCQAPKQRACSIAQVNAEGGMGVGVIPSADDHCTEIVQSRADGGGGQTDVVPPAGGPLGLRLSIQAYNLKPIVRSRATYQFFVENASPAPDQQMQLRVTFPPELVPDMSTLQADVDAQLVGNELRFNPVAEIRANERLSFTVTTSVLRAGIVNIVAEVTSSKFPAGVQKTEQVEIVGF